MVEPLLNAARGRRLERTARTGLAAIVTVVGVTAVVTSASLTQAQFRTFAAQSTRPRLAPSSDAQTVVSLDLVRAWVRAANAHQPGRADAAAQTIADWSNTTLETTLTDVSELSQGLAWLYAVDRACVPHPDRPCVPNSGRVNYRKRTFALFKPEDDLASAPSADGAYVVREAAIIESLTTLLGATPDDERDGTMNRLLERGALLHTDIALLLPARHPTNGASSDHAPGTSTAVRVADGAVLDVESGTEHWRYARYLLDAVEPNPSRFARMAWDNVVASPRGDPFVLDWYRATSAARGAEAHWSEVTPNLDRAIELFPNDPSILIQAGEMHEAFASASLQASARAAVRAGLSQAVQLDRAEWQKALTLLQRATLIDPSSAEAHLHFGHVLGALGQHAAALHELQLAVGHVDDPALEYDAAMFLGRVQEDTGDLAAARASFERASILWPGAQSALVALSQVLRRSDNADAALAPLTRALANPADGVEGAGDPLWTYPESYAHHAAALMDALRRPFLTGGGR